MDKFTYLTEKAKLAYGDDENLTEAFFLGANIMEQYMKNAKKKREVCRCKLATYYVEEGINYCLKCDLPLP